MRSRKAIYRVLDSGLVIETEFGQDLLQDMIPEDLPPTELTLELILPTWLQTATGEDSIVLVERTNGEDELNITLKALIHITQDMRFLILMETKFVLQMKRIGHA